MFINCTDVQEYIYKQYQWTRKTVHMYTNIFINCTKGEEYTYKLYSCTEIFTSLLPRPARGGRPAPTLTASARLSPTSTRTESAR